MLHFGLGRKRAFSAALNTASAAWPIPGAEGVGGVFGALDDWNSKERHHVNQAGFSPGPTSDEHGVIPLRAVAVPDLDDTCKGGEKDEVTDWR